MVKEEYNYSLNELESIVGEVFVVGFHNGLPEVTKPNGKLFDKEDIKKLAEIVNHYMSEIDEEEIKENNLNINLAISNGTHGNRGRKETEKEGYIYLLEADTGETKIGRTKELDDRIYHFTTKLPMDLKVIYYVKTNDSYALERRLHEHYAIKRTRGEWFYLNEEDIQDIQNQYKMNVYRTSIVV